MSKLKDIIKTSRVEYLFEELNQKDLSRNPVSQFEKWMTEAIVAGIKDTNSATLATVAGNGYPNARIVLLRGIEKNGFSFFTNYHSAKGKELENKKACLNFFWPTVWKQIKIIGKAKKLSIKENDAYFSTRPRESQIGAWASNQSSVIKNRKYLDDRFAYYDKKFYNQVVPRPPYWGGYVITPLIMEFWQGRMNRLHDRIQYKKMKDGKWKLERLAP